MAEKRKARKKKEEVDEKPSKDEYAVAKYLRANLPVKKTTLFSHKVEYFIASKAVECLLDSEWATNKKGHESLFSSRESIVHYLHKMLVHKFFHRAKKIPVSHKDVKQKKKSSKEKDEESSHAEEGKDKKASSKRKTEKGKDNEKAKEKEEKKEVVEAGKEKKKEKRKIKLDMHLEQVFVDGNEAYVWIYDPVPTTAWLIGGLLVVGAILLCLFPLWPSSVRKGVYYISIAAAGFLCVIVALIIVRIIIFCLIWVITFGRHHLWILPNLTEDVGFFESFWPLFKYEYKGPESSVPEEETKEEKQDTKAPGDTKEPKTAGDAAGKDDAAQERDSEREPTDTDRESEESCGDGGEERQPHVASGTDNGFEMVNQDELETEKFS